MLTPSDYLADLLIALFAVVGMLAILLIAFYMLIKNTVAPELHAVAVALIDLVRAYRQKTGKKSLFEEGDES